MFMAHTDGRPKMFSMSKLRQSRKLKKNWKSIGKNKTRPELLPKMSGFSEKIYKLWLHSIGVRNKNNRHMWVSCLAASDVRHVRLRDFLCIFSASEALWFKHIGNRAAETDGFSRREFVRKLLLFFRASEAGEYSRVLAHIFNPMMAYENKRFFCGVLFLISADFFFTTIMTRKI